MLIILAILFCCCIFCVMFGMAGRDPGEYVELEITKEEDDTIIGSQYQGDKGKPIKVINVDPGTATDGVFEVGDVIISINGNSATSGADATSDYLDGLPAGTYPAVVRRDKKATKLVADAKQRAKSTARRVSTVGRRSMPNQVNQRVLSTTVVDVHVDTASTSAAEMPSSEAGSVLASTKNSDDEP